MLMIFGNKKNLEKNRGHIHKEYVAPYMTKQRIIEEENIIIKRFTI